MRYPKPSILRPDGECEMAHRWQLLISPPAFPMRTVAEKDLFVMANTGSL